MPRRHPPGTPLKKSGPKSRYTPELGLRICKVVGRSSIGLDRLHRKYPWFPNRGRIMAWREEHAEFDRMYTRAKREQAHRFEEEQRTIADQLVRKVGKEPTRVTNVRAQVAKLRIEARRWSAARLAPRDFGDKVDLTSGGEALFDDIGLLSSEVSRLSNEFAVAADKSKKKRKKA